MKKMSNNTEDGVRKTDNRDTMEFRHEVVIPNEDLPFKMFIFEGKDGNYKVSTHWHQSVEIFLVTEGTIDFYIDSHYFSLKEHQFVIVNSNQVHSIDCPYSNNTIVLQIPVETFQLYHRETPYISFIPQSQEKNRELAALVEQMYATYDAKEYGYELKVRSQFYELFVEMLPYSTTSEWVANKALKEMFDTYEPFTEMCKKQGVVNLGPVVPSEVVIVSTDKAINGLDDMQGLKIRAMGAVNSEMTMLGATPVALDASEIYEALERDTVAAATGIPVTLAVSYKLQEVADYFIFSGIGTYTTSSLYMNEKTWNSLPTDIQEAFRTVYDRFVDEYSSDDWMGGELKKSIKAIEDAGKTVIALDETEQAKWAEKLESTVADFVAKADSYGYNGQEILDTYRALVEKYEPMDIAYQVYGK